MDETMSLPEDVTALLEQLELFAQKLPEHLKASGRKILVAEYIDLAASANKDYDLNALLGDELSNYDPEKASISVLVKDTDNTSSTYEYYVNGEAVIVAGIKDGHNVRLSNRFTDTLALYVRIEVPRKLPT